MDYRLLFRLWISIVQTLDYENSFLNVSNLKLHKSAKSAIKHISPRDTASQLALSHHVGFGTIKNDKQATLILIEHSLQYTDL